MESGVVLRFPTKIVLVRLRTETKRQRLSFECAVPHDGMTGCERKGVRVTGLGDFDSAQNFRSLFIRRQTKQQQLAGHPETSRHIQITAVRKAETMSGHEMHSLVTGTEI